MHVRASLLGLAAVLLAVPANADEKVSEKSAHNSHVKGVASVLESDKCGTTQDDISLNASFHLKADSFGDAKKQFEEKVQQLEDLAKKENSGKFDQLSMNYNINLTHPNADDVVAHGQYTLNGSASYRLENADKAIKIAELLKSEKFHVGVSENKFIVQCNPSE